MGRQIVKQPNGKYCIFSSIVDNVTFYDMTPEDIIEQWVTESRDRIAKDVLETIGQLDRGESPYYQFGKTYTEMISFIKEVHGSKEVEKLVKLIEPK